MTRITTLCSGLARAGKTHLGINLACEMVRRGRHAALFSEPAPQAGIDGLLSLPGMQALQRRSTDHGESLLRRAYLGVDVLASGIPLSAWNDASSEVLDAIIADMESGDDCDEFLVDTSGMDPRAQLACCQVASTVILLLTEDPRSCAETFALIRILRLNGFHGEFRLVVNRLAQVADAHALYASFSGTLKEHLGIDIPLLGVMNRDVHVQRAEHTKQAFTCVFPEAVVSGQLVAIADALDADAPDGPPGGKSISRYWGEVRELLAQPVLLPGDGKLEVVEDRRVVPEMYAPHVQETSSEVSLLQFDSSFHEFTDQLDRLPGILNAAADEVSVLRRLLETFSSDGLHEDLRKTNDRDALPALTVALIREIEEVIVPSQGLHLEVLENRVQGDDPDWLQDGRYLKFMLCFQGADEVLSRIRVFLEDITGFVHYTAAEGESLWEMVVADRSGGMNIIHSTGDNIRLQVWLPLQSRLDTARKSRLKLVKPSLPTGKNFH